MIKRKIILKILIQLISLYRAFAMFVFILFYTLIPNSINSFLLITAISSDLLDGFLAKKFELQSTGGALLDLFSDKYLNCILILYLIIEEYPLIPLLMILTKEIFVLSFRSIKVNGKFIISTNRIIGGIMSGMLWSIAFLHTNNVDILNLIIPVVFLGFTNSVYLIYKIISNLSSIIKIFKS